MSTLVSVTRAKRPLVPISWAIPGIIFCLLFHYVAVLAGGWYAFTDWNGLSTPRFVGLDNFVEILGDSNSLGALINTLVLASAFVIGSNGIGLALAVALHRTLKLRFVLRSLFFAPVVMSPLAVSYIWQFILDARGPSTPCWPKWGCGLCSAYGWATAHLRSGRSHLSWCGSFRSLHGFLSRGPAIDTGRT